MRRLALIVTGVGYLLAAAPARADDVQTIRTRLIDSYTAISAPPGAAGVAAAQAAIASTAQATLATVQPDGSFVDVKYTDQPTASWSVNTHYARLVALAQAYAIPGGPLYHSAQVVDAIERALKYGSTYYCGSAACVGKGGNWWYWQIGVPRNLLPTLILTDGALDPAVRALALNAVRYHVGDFAHLRTFTGENLVWCAFNHLRFGVLGVGTAELTAARDALESVSVINPGTLQEGDGIKPDHSFQQHRGLIYTGGYGASFAADVANYLLLTQGTAYTLTKAAQATIVDYIADGVPWEVSGGYWDTGVIGRGITVRTPIPNAAAARDALVRAAELDTPRQPELRAGAKALIEQLGNGGIDLLTRSAAVQATPGPSELPSGHRHYFSSDQTVHRRADYYASIKMFSTRTQSGEVVNEQGKRGARQSDGHLYLVRTGKEYFSRSLWPALDWTRLPGITVEQSPSAADVSLGIGTRDFVGGTGDGQNGVSAMDSAPLASQLTAQKSWFFFEDFIVFLGSKISAGSAYPVETIVMQWPLSKPDQPLVADGLTIATGPTSKNVSASWLEADGLGYYFPNAGQQVKAEIKDQSGTWASLGTSTGTAQYRFLTLAIEHGVRPANASYAYAITLRDQDMATWSKSQPFTILQNDAKLAAVQAGTATGVVFWSAGRVKVASDVTLTSDTPAVVWLTDDGNHLGLNVADPAGKPGTLKVSLSGSFVEGKSTSSGSQVVLSASGAQVTIDRAQGATRSAQFARSFASVGAGGEGGASSDPGGPANGGGSFGGEKPSVGAGAGGALQSSGGSPSTAAAPAEASGCTCSVPARGQGSALSALMCAALATLGVYRRRRSH